MPAMPEKWTIQTPARGDQLAACRLVVAGRGDKNQPSRQGDALHQLLSLRRPDEYWLRWARPTDRPSGPPGGACVVLADPGKVGVALYPAAGEDGVDEAALSRAIAAATDDALSDGLSLVQSIPPEGAEADVAVLVDAGFRLLAELQYMRRDLTGKPEPHLPQREEVTVESFGEYSQEELAAVIQATYQDSLDCPGLAELREMDDVLEGYRATGIFNPSTWWLVRWEGQAAGCVLVNQSISGEAQMVYLGVIPAFRGRGLARWMTAAVMQACWQEGLTAMTLAVDCRNATAARAYRDAGLTICRERNAYIKHC